MNKEQFINALMEKTHYSYEKCVLINDVLETKSCFRKKHQPIIVDMFKKSLEIDEEEAVNIFATSKDILSSELKHRICHPFGKRK